MHGMEWRDREIGQWSPLSQSKCVSVVHGKGIHCRVLHQRCPMRLQLSSVLQRQGCPYSTRGGTVTYSVAATDSSIQGSNWRGGWGGSTPPVPLFIPLWPPQPPQLFSSCCVADPPSSFFTIRPLLPSVNLFIHRNAVRQFLNEFVRRAEALALQWQLPLLLNLVRTWK